MCSMCEGHNSTAAAAGETANNEVTEENVNAPTEPDGYSELRKACREVKLDEAREIIAQNPGLDLNLSDPDQDGKGYTPLLDLISEAVMNEDGKDAPDFVRFLVAHGADVKAQDTRGWTGLHHCARWNNDISVDMAKVLIELGADVSANQRITPKPQPDAVADSNEHDHEHTGDGCECGQHIGAMLGNAFKLATGKDLDLTEQTKELDVTPLHHACGYGDNLPIVKLLLEHGAKIDVNDFLAGTPVLVAAQDGREEICALLLSKPGGTACLSMRKKTGRLPIHVAAENGTKNIVAMLVEAGSLVDPIIEGNGVEDREKGLTPLLLACKNADRHGKLDVIEYLLDHGAKTAHVAGQGQTALLLSVLAKNVEAAQLLVKHGADPKAVVGPFEDVNALHVAATAGAADLCQWLVNEAAIGVDTHDDQGYTALINAAGYSNSPETIRMLVSTLGANIEASIDDGRRALHFSAFKGQEAGAKELVALGADKEAVDGAGWTPMHFAARYHHADVIRLLLDSGAEVGRKVDGGPRPKRKDGEEFDISGFTAVDLARIIRGGQDCVDILVAAGDTLSDETKDLVDDDLWEEQGGSCCVM
ncbi:ankyrin repeat-containing domain protein [Thelonectria olida]|uniref:Ankyrin repeat-containing domain protein n=1 Tax=Thelonectria olida TaxID=1576542 RepID=A0A9P9AKR2_9HYPO|nr:ankyrin repeat-containing domain protein [Thelonectria olida]